VVVSGQHQVDVLPLCPADVVRRMTQAEAKRARRAGCQVWFWPEPGPLVTNHHQGLVVHVNLLPTIVQDAKTQPAQAAADPRGIKPGVVVPQDAVSGDAPAQLAKHGKDPAMVLFTIHDVPCESNQVGFPIAADSHDVLVKTAIRGTTKMEIA